MLGMTGASGAVYGLKLLDHLKPCSLVVSKNAKDIIEWETESKFQDVKNKADNYFEDADLAAPIASGSHGFDAMVIAPCSMNTLSKISVGIADTLITRAAAVALKERIPLILVPRETPLSLIHIQAMERCTLAGAIILPPTPQFYDKPKTVDDMTDYIVGKVLDMLKIEHGLYRGWEGMPRK